MTHKCLTTAKRRWVLPGKWPKTTGAWWTNYGSVFFSNYNTASVLCLLEDRCLKYILGYTTESMEISQTTTIMFTCLLMLLCKICTSIANAGD
ncbi:hypothetical protein DICVIV_12759 [Dictyocaulus viviparus]|uniref:Uncharacterized protein n=1 Tax=Dictyocaulus viviparus TaxID=29172 RepID=A0A0D8X9N1_DICVI|nr:hypothetical protein DICVIV_12759 [Dictyocaulus viviparus]